MRQVFLDTETTGLILENGNRIVEIGCVELLDRQLTGFEFHAYLNPNRPMEAGAERVHGLTDEFLSDKPQFAECAEDLLQYLEGADELLMHNAEFDLSFVNAELERIPHLNAQVWHDLKKVDTLKLAQNLLPGRGGYNLDALCRLYSVDLGERDKHSALLDSRLLAQVYLNLTSQQMKMDLGVKRRKLEHSAEVRETRVQRASPEELALHEAFMQRLAS